MNTIDRLDPVCWVPLHPRSARPAFASWRAWFGRLWQGRATTAPPRRDDDFGELAELDPHTLADIGAPQRLLERALARREARRQEREGLHVGLASGAWHHW